jgi:predicted secreted protein
VTAYDAFGTQLRQGGTTATSGTLIAQITNISGPGLSADTIDVTAHDSTGGYRNFLQGLKDGGEITLDINYDPAGATHKNASGGLLYAFDQGTQDNYALVFPDAATTTWVVPAIVTGFEVGAPMDNKLSASATLKVSGKPTLV